MTRLALVGAIAATVLTGCGTAEVAGTPAPGVTTVVTAVKGTAAEVPSAARAIPPMPPAEEWPTHTDDETGLRFAMPGYPQRQTRPGDEAGTTPTIRQYRLEVEGGLELGVAWSESPAADFSAEGLEWVADQIADSLIAAGSDDAEIVDRERTTVGARPVLDFRVSFTTTKGERTVWLVRIIGDGTRSVQVHSMAATAPEGEAALLPVVDAYQELLVAGIQMP